jgi:hypothetical protein
MVPRGVSKWKLKMRLVIDELEGPYYMDVVLSPEEVERMKLGEMIDGCACINGKTFYVGARMNGRFQYEKEDSWPEEDQEGYE